MDVRDWFIILHVNAAGIAGTAFMFVHPSPAAFATWAGLISTIIGCYHWFTLRDQKTEDAK